jgi:hypothetical protein
MKAPEAIISGCREDAAAATLGLVSSPQECLPRETCVVATVGASISLADKLLGTRADFNVIPDFGTIELVRA